MPREIIHYTNNEVTVVWKPKVCIHSKICWNELIEVFNPRERPWVKIEGATTERIIEQVRKCPSGALSYFLNEEITNETSPEKVVAGSATVTKINVTPNGPYIISNECLIVHCDGKEEIRTGIIGLCRCGHSSNKPYCDGSHRQAGFSG